MNQYWFSSSSNWTLVPEQSPTPFQPVSQMKRIPKNKNFTLGTWYNEPSDLEVIHLLKKDFFVCKKVGGLSKTNSLKATLKL